MDVHRAVKDHISCDSVCAAGDGNGCVRSGVVQGYRVRAGRGTQRVAVRVGELDASTVTGLVSVTESGPSCRHRTRHPLPGRSARCSHQLAAVFQFPPAASFHPDAVRTRPTRGAKVIRHGESAKRAGAGDCAPAGGAGIGQQRIGADSVTEAGQSGEGNRGGAGQVQHAAEIDLAAGAVPVTPAKPNRSTSVVSALIRCWTSVCPLCRLRRE